MYMVDKYAIIEHKLNDIIKNDSKRNGKNELAYKKALLERNFIEIEKFERKINSSIKAHIICGAEIKLIELESKNGGFYFLQKKSAVYLTV